MLYQCAGECDLWVSIGIPLVQLQAHPDLLFQIVLLMVDAVSGVDLNPTCLKSVPFIQMDFLLYWQLKYLPKWAVAH